jgi:hypothetical protein
MADQPTPTPHDPGDVAQDLTLYASLRDDARAYTYQLCAYATLIVTVIGALAGLVLPAVIQAGLAGEGAVSPQPGALAQDPRLWLVLLCTAVVFVVLAHAISGVAKLVQVRQYETRRLHAHLQGAHAMPVRALFHNDPEAVGLYVVPGLMLVTLLFCGIVLVGLSDWGGGAQAPASATGTGGAALSAANADGAPFLGVLLGGMLAGLGYSWCYRRTGARPPTSWRAVGIWGALSVAFAFPAYWWSCGEGWQRGTPFWSDVQIAAIMFSLLPATLTLAWLRLKNVQKQIVLLDQQTRAIVRETHGTSLPPPRTAARPYYATLAAYATLGGTWAATCYMVGWWAHSLVR